MTIPCVYRLTQGDVTLDDEGKSKKASYLMPAMDFDETRHETVLQEAEDMDLALQGKKVGHRAMSYTQTSQLSLFPSYFQAPQLISRVGRWLNGGLKQALHVSCPVLRTPAECP